jgi:hypothetical protein
VLAAGELVQPLHQDDVASQMRRDGGLAEVADEELAGLAVLELAHAGLEELLNGLDSGLDYSKSE